MRRASRAISILLALLIVFAFPAAAAFFGSDKTDAKQGEQKKPEPKVPTIKETLSAIGVISQELKGIDAIERRLATIEKSVAGIDASLAPVGKALGPEGLQQIANLVVDTAYERAKNVVMLVSVFGALLIAFAALMLRWSLAGRRAAPLSASPLLQEPVNSKRAG